MAQPDRSAELAELLEPYKRNEGSFGVAVVIGNDTAIKVVASFQLVALPPWRKPRTKQPEGTLARWKWLWSGFKGGPDYPEFLIQLAAAAGASEQSVYNCWPTIMASRLVYPDGSLSENAADMVGAFVVRHLPRVRPQAQPRPARPAAPAKEGK